MKTPSLAFLLFALVCGLLLGCANNAPSSNDGTAVDGTTPGTNGSTSGPGDSGGTGGTGGTGGSGTVNALNYGGNLSGSVSTSSSTMTASASASGRPVNAQELPSGASAWITDIQGNRLKDAAGNEYSNFTVKPDGTFDASGLPTGVDLVVNIDVDGDGKADVQTIVNIPVDANGNGGQLANVTVDPLSTLSFAKLVGMLKAAGVDPSKLNLSFSALIGRIRDAFENLSDDSGIDLNIDLADILALPPDQLAALFDKLIPEGAQRGMKMFQGNIALAAADDVAGVVKAVASILLQGGFVIADAPGGVDLSFLANEPNIRTTTFQQYMQEQRAGQDQSNAAPAPQGFEPTLYLSTVSEPDRNFANATQGNPHPGAPIFNEQSLTRMAEAYLAGKTITLQQLYHLLVDVNAGLGVRLIYQKFRGPNLPPVQVFESPDGAGVERDMQQLMQQIMTQGLDSPGTDPQTRDALLRQLLITFLTGTAEPSFDRLFGPLLMNPIPSADDVARFLRDKRAHLPFSRTGPSQLFFLATADSFRDSSAEPVHVSVDVDSEGSVTKVRADSAGKFFVGFGPPTEGGMLCGLVNASNGRMLHNHKGQPQFVQIADASIFENVGDQTFLDAFSDSGNNFPGAPALTVPNWGFDPSKPEDPKTNPRSFQLFVLTTQPGPDGVPVLVDYNAENGIATFNETNGQYYLVFDPETVNGKFALVKANGEPVQTTPGDFNTRVLIAAADVQGLPPLQTDFIHIFGIRVANPAYDSAGAPYYDDINNNGVEDEGEPTFSERYFLGMPDDWHSTFVEQYYRKASDNGFPSSEDIDWGSNTPKLKNGDPLVPRKFRPRFNAFLFGRPNVAVNLLMAFNPPESFDGTHALNADTPLNPFTVLALCDLVLESVQNVEASVDFDGPGGAPPHTELIDAQFFLPPVGDPVQLLVTGFGGLVGGEKP